MTCRRPLLALLLCVWAAAAAAVPPKDSRYQRPRHAHTAKKAAKAPAVPSLSPCRSDIDPAEAREIVIMKMQQRMDCLENKLNYLAEQLSLQSGGTVRPFAEPPKDYVIQYPRPDAP